MSTRRADKWLCTAAITIVLGSALVYAHEQKTKDVPYVPTPQNVVDKMLEMASVATTCHRAEAAV